MGFKFPDDLDTTPRVRVMGTDIQAAANLGVVIARLVVALEKDGCIYCGRGYAGTGAPDPWTLIHLEDCPWVAARALLKSLED